MPKKKVAEQTHELAVDQKAKISIDLGNSGWKIHADGGITADGRSVIGRVSSANQLKHLPFDSTLKIDGAWYVFGNDAFSFAAQNIEDFPTKDRYVSDWYKRLFAFALFKAYGLRLGEGVFYPRVIASVPASEFKIKQRVEQIKQRLVGEYELETTHGTCLHVVILPENIILIPEGAGSYYRLLAEDQGKGNSRYAAGTWPVLDIGYLTGDIVIFRDSNYIADRSDSDVEIGIRHIALEVARHVYINNGPDQDPREYDNQLNCDSIVVSGVTYNIKEVRDQKIAELSERVNRFLRKTTIGLNIAGVIVTGGGAERYFDHIQISYPKVKAPDPRRANVDGAFLMLERNSGSPQKK